MKTTHRFRPLLVGLVSLFVVLIASKSFASAVDMFLKIEDEKGKVTKVPINQDGTFQTPPLKAGTYSWSWGVGRGIGSPMGGSKDRESSAPSVSEKCKITLTHEIVSPRDVSTGMATGKRQHKPMTITKELDRTAPTLDLGSLVVDEDCDGIAGTVSFKTKGGKTMAVDDWSK
jgi:hypothetical protein